MVSAGYMLTAILTIVSLSLGASWKIFRYMGSIETRLVIMETRMSSFFGPTKRAVKRKAAVKRTKKNVSRH